ncbi:MAG: tyrosine-type recombinase/integrase [Candidatus Spyradosoma sp.]
MRKRTKKTTKVSISQDELVAVRQLLAGSKLGLVDSVRLAVELHECAGKNLCVNTLRSVIRMGVEAMKRNRASVTVDKLCEIFCADRSDLRSRTLSDYHYVWRKLRERFPDFIRRRARAVDPADVREILLTGFRTARQRCKARSILHALFTYAERRRWVSNNPVSEIILPQVREQEIVPLSLAEIRRLLECVRTWDSGSCAPAAGLMLFAGIRPREVERLRWRDIDFEENVISIRAVNSKTGGTRHVTICAPLRALLQESVRKLGERAHADATIVPPNWETRWKEVRRSAGWNTTTNVWRQDVLRHTFASYHAKFYRDYRLLQFEMGHTSSNLLRTRYVSMVGVTRADAENFWTLDVLRGGWKKDFAGKPKLLLPAPLPAPAPKPPPVAPAPKPLPKPPKKAPRKARPKPPPPVPPRKFAFALRPPTPLLPCAEATPPRARSVPTPDRARVFAEIFLASPAPRFLAAKRVSAGAPRRADPPEPLPRALPDGAEPGAAVGSEPRKFAFALRPPPLMLPCAEATFFRTAEILRDVAKGGFIELPWLPPAELFPPPPPPLPPDVPPLPVELNPSLTLIRGGANFRC